MPPSPTLYLAPMVRASTTPLRLLSLHYGAQKVYTEETIDRAIIATTRTPNTTLHTIDYKKETKLVLRIHEQERKNVIFQIGSADPEMALRAARKVQGDVAGIDLNCGCPKHFSTHGGMGSKLLTEPDKLCLVRNRNEQIETSL